MAVAHSHEHTIQIPRTKKVLYLVALALAPIACIGLYLVNPAAKDDPYPNCPFFLMTGYFCPGCGTLRAYHQLLHGDAGHAFGLNPLTVLALPATVYAATSMWLTGYRGRGLPQPRWTANAGWGVAIVLAVFGVVRNLPLDALEWMRP